MTRSSIGAAACGCALALVLLGTAPAPAWDRGNVQQLTVLPGLKASGAPSAVEGLTVGPDGNIYATSFGFNTQGSTTGPADLFVVSPDGKVINQVTIAGASPHMLGLAFNPATNQLWVLDFGAGTVLAVDPKSGASSVLAGPIANSGLNGLAFDASGNGYVSDSFNGTIWKIPPHGGSFSAWLTGPLLSPGTGLTPPFGANGIAFSNDRSTMYMANTAFHQIVQIPVANSNGTLVAGTPSILTTGINAPDGILVDRKGNVWICANQEDEIVVIDPKGGTDPTTGQKIARVIAKRGDFYGIDQNGIAQGFLFPASPAFSQDDRTLYVSNLTLFLPYAGANLAIDSPAALQVKGYTISRMSADLPPVPDGSQ